MGKKDVLEASRGIAAWIADESQSQSADILAALSSKASRANIQAPSRMGLKPVSKDPCPSLSVAKINAEWNASGMSFHDEWDAFCLAKGHVS